MTRTYHLEPQTGIGLAFSKGQILRITDPAGEQVSDLAAFSADDITECFSPGRTIDYAQGIYITSGGLLYSNRSQAMLTIVDDSVGRHDLLLAPCSEAMFRIVLGVQGHPSCLTNLALGLGQFGIGEDQILGTFNAFMNVAVLPGGKVDIGPPHSKSGDYVELRAEMDLFVGITACSSENTNNGSLKPIDVEVRG